jgi:membrane protein
MLLEIIRDFLPSMAYESVKETIIDIITRPRSSILIMNLLLTLYFSTNGVNSLMEAFNNTYHTLEARSWLHQYGISVMIVLINSLLLILSIGLMTFGSALLRWLIPEFLDNSIFLLIVLQILRWAIILSLLLSAISFVYYFAPAGKKRFNLISPGSLFATVLIIVTTLAFNFYVDHFSTYNALYGSLGTLMIVLFWIYINAISLLVGFELDASILNAGK